MLKTYDLYKRPGYRFEINDLVEFKLSEDYKLKRFYGYSKRGRVEKSKNKNPNQTITGRIINYKPEKLRDLEIELIINNGHEISLKLSQCEDLKILE